VPLEVSTDVLPHEVKVYLSQINVRMLDLVARFRLALVADMAFYDSFKVYFSELVLCQRQLLDR